jgi:hypothetical protein
MSSGLLRDVVFRLYTNVSEEHTASTFRSEVRNVNEDWGSVFSKIADTHPHHCKHYEPTQDRGLNQRPPEYETEDVEAFSDCEIQTHGKYSKSDS